jgi:thymidylate synthase
MNNIDKTYTDLLQDILDNGVEKKDRTGTGTLSVFGRQIRHDMKEGFPLLTTKKMAFKTMVTELLWFLRGDTNIKYLVDNDCHIWDGDAYKNYCKSFEKQSLIEQYSFDTDPMSQEMFINKIKTDDEFAEKWGELGKIYGWQWRSWGYDSDKWREDYNKLQFGSKEEIEHLGKKGIDQIANLINDLKTNPDSRRLMVNAWNVGELDQMVLPPCHYGFEVYTRELSISELNILYNKRRGVGEVDTKYTLGTIVAKDPNIPTRVISLMWNQRSVDTFLGLPFNIASYGLLLTMIADEVNMVPDELIGSLGETHLYLNHIEQAKEQIGRELTIEERTSLFRKQQNLSDDVDFVGTDRDAHSVFDDYGITKRTREPFPLPTVSVNDGIYCSSIYDVILENYQSHLTIKAPLSN